MAQAAISGRLRSWAERDLAAQRAGLGIDNRQRVGVGVDHRQDPPIGRERQRLRLTAGHSGDEPQAEKPAAKNTQTQSRALCPGAPAYARALRLDGDITSLPTAPAEGR